MAGKSNGPWGGGGSGGGSPPPRGNGGGGRPGGQGGGGPEIDDLMKRGSEQLRMIIGGGSGGLGGGGAPLNRFTGGIGVFLVLAAWLWASVYTVQPDERGVELFLGEYYRTTENGLRFAPWPVVTAEVIKTSTERVENIGVGRSSVRSDVGLMLTTDENIVDIDFQVVWNVNDPAKFLFNLRDPRETVRVVSESAMREVIAQSELAPILNRDRDLIADTAQGLIQNTMNAYDSGVHIVRLNFDKADPPEEVIDSFRDVQAAEQERDRLQREADAYANRVLAGARGESARILEDAEAYRARVVNEAEGEASRFVAVLEEYVKAPEVTRKRLYIETMEEVLGDANKILLEDTGGAGQGVVPYLPLNELMRGNTRQGGN